MMEEQATAGLSFETRDGDCSPYPGGLSLGIALSSTFGGEEIVVEADQRAELELDGTLYTLAVTQASRRVAAGECSSAAWIVYRSDFYQRSAEPP